jgi:hypothetical protein
MRFFATLLVAAAACFSFEQDAAAYQERTLCVGVGETANTNDEYYAAWPAKGTWEITDVTFAPMTAVALDASNVVAFTVQINAGTASTSWTTIASTTTDSDLSGVAYVIGTVLDLTVDKPSTISRGYTIQIENTNGGTGQIWEGVVCVAARKVG